MLSNPASRHIFLRATTGTSKPVASSDGIKPSGNCVSPHTRCFQNRNRRQRGKRRRSKAGCCSPCGLVRKVGVNSKRILYQRRENEACRRLLACLVGCAVCPLHKLRSRRRRSSWKGGITQTDTRHTRRMQHNFQDIDNAALAFHTHSHFYPPSSPSSFSSSSSSTYCCLPLQPKKMPPSKTTNTHTSC